MQVRKQIAAEGNWAKHNWVVKADLYWRGSTGTFGLSLFCFSVDTKDTGCTKTGHVLELLQISPWC